MTGAWAEYNCRNTASIACVVDSVTWASTLRCSSRNSDRSE
jgi:hypothetical protein